MTDLSCPFVSCVFCLKLTLWSFLYFAFFLSHPTLQRKDKSVDKPTEVCGIQQTEKTCRKSNADVDHFAAFAIWLDFKKNIHSQNENDLNYLKQLLTVEFKFNFHFLIVTIATQHVDQSGHLLFGFHDPSHGTIWNSPPTHPSTENTAKSMQNN